METRQALSNSYQLVEEENTSIYIYPQARSKNPEYNKDKVLVLGDLHSSSVKLLHFLIRENVLEIKSEKTKSGLSDLFSTKNKSPKEMYEQFIKICKKDVDVANHPLLKSRTLDQLLSQNKRTIPNIDERLKKFKTESKNLKQLKKSDISFVRNLFKDLILQSKPAMMIFIGDETADRMNNPDAYPIWIFEKLHKGNFEFSILHSNHGAEFLKNALSGLKDFLQNDAQKLLTQTSVNTRVLYNTRICQHDQSLSLQNLGAAILNGLIDKDELIATIKESYLPHLKLFVCLPSEKGVDIFTHGLVGLETIQGFADALCISYNDETPQALQETIELINQEFNNFLLNCGPDFDEFLTLGDKVVRSTSPRRREKDGVTDINLLAYHYFQLIWKRDQNHRQLDNGKFPIMWWHGHDSTPEEAPQAKTLDNASGKEFSYMVGQFKVSKADDKEYFVPTPFSEIDSANQEAATYTALRMEYDPLVLNKRLSNSSVLFPSNENNNGNTGKDASPKEQFSKQYKK